jgi:hypothetical protein
MTSRVNERSDRLAAPFVSTPTCFHKGIEPIIMRHHAPLNAIAKLVSLIKAVRESPPL